MSRFIAAACGFWILLVTGWSLPSVAFSQDTPPAPGADPSPNGHLVNLIVANSLDAFAPAMPKPGDTSLSILSPTLLELRLITSGDPGTVALDSWDFVNSDLLLSIPDLSRFVVTVDGIAATVQSVGFKRRPLYAPLRRHDLRIDNRLFLKLATPIAVNQTVRVTNPDGALWDSDVSFVETADPLRHSPVIHVNQEGYVPSFPKRARIGYYLGSMGEMIIPASLGFHIVDATTGEEVFDGELSVRLDMGFTSLPAPYQNVLQADFSDFTTPGSYRLRVPGLGASLPFRIHDGIAMNFLRTYALGLYHQRCGTDNALPFTRFTHDDCHAAHASVPSPQSGFSFTWGIIAQSSADYANNPRHTAPRLKDEASQLYPFVNQGPIDVTRGHHDAGDYSKYTINSANLLHYLMFTVDSIPGAADLDNLGLPESGDGIPDLLQEAAWEAEFLSRMQDADGGFYFLVYPRDRRYESNVTPDHGDPQLVWPKNTAVTAAAVAALAQTASSSVFKRHYPNEAARYLDQARLGWQFLMNAIDRHGRDGAYQKITHYGDNYMHDDELAWAACELFLATGEPGYHEKLTAWFDPSDPNTRRWGWWRMSESWGNAIRSYAFSARTGRRQAGQLDAAFLAGCEEQILAAADDAVTWSDDNAYGTSFPAATKRMNTAGWYFSSDHASDAAIGHLLDPNPGYIRTLVANMDFEAGANPVNVSYVTGLGWKRQRETVHQYAQNDRRVLPPIGIPLGNVQNGFAWLDTYQGELRALCYPQDEAEFSPYPLYDRWGDSYNVMTEFVHLNQARGIVMFALLASQTTARTQPWTSATAQIATPHTVVPVGQPVTLSLAASHPDLTTARITWEARDQEPAYGPTYTISPKYNGDQWVEAEIHWPDGRRVFATATFTANNPVMIWVDDSLPAGAQSGAEGGDGWNWAGGNPAPHAGSTAHQSNLAGGQHGHFFDNATDTLAIEPGDTMFAHVHLDPDNVPSEIMLMWNNGDWEHRAYWGANHITYGLDGTDSRRYMGPLPAPGQWVRLEVPAGQVGLEGTIVKGMAFYTFDGRATWDEAGKTSATTATPPPDPSGTISITSIQKAGAHVRITWSSEPGRNYRVAAKNSLTDPAWTDVSGNLPATDTTTAWTDENAGQFSLRFYRIRPVN